MRLRLQHPEVAYRSCVMCTEFMVDHKTGEFNKDRHGNLIKRPKGVKPPCGYGVKECAKVSPEKASHFELSPKNEAAYQHYKECRAVGQFPDDATVRRNASLIRAVEDDCEKLHQIQLIGLRR